VRLAPGVTAHLGNQGYETIDQAKHDAAKRWCAVNNWAALGKVDVPRLPQSQLC